MSNPQLPDNGRRVTPANVVLPRLMWVALGPFGLFLCGIKMLGSGGQWLTSASVIYLLILAAMFGGRYLEQRSGFGLDSTGEPATWADFRNYGVVVIPALIGVWIVLNIVAALG